MPTARRSPGGDGDRGAPFPGRCVDVVRIVRPVAPEVADGVVHLLKQTGQDLAIRPLFGGDLHGQHLLDVGINGPMDLAPSAPFPRAMPPDCPFPLPIDFPD